MHATGDLQAVTFEDAAQHLGAVKEADAVGDADFLEAHSLRELTHFLDLCPFAVAVRFVQFSGDLKIAGSCMPLRKQHTADP